MDNSAVSRTLMAYSKVRGFQSCAASSLNAQMADYEQTLSRFTFRIDQKQLDYSEMDSIKSVSLLLVRFARSNMAFEDLLPFWHTLYCSLKTREEQSWWVHLMSEQLPSACFTNLARLISTGGDPSNLHSISESTFDRLTVLINSTENELLLALLACVQKVDKKLMEENELKVKNEIEEEETEWVEGTKAKRQIESSVENVQFYGLSQSAQSNQPISVQISPFGAYVSCSLATDHSVRVYQMDMMAPTIFDKLHTPYLMSLQPSTNPTIVTRFLQLQSADEPARFLVCAGRNIQVYDLQESDFQRLLVHEWMDESLVWDISIDSANQRLASAHEHHSINIYSTSHMVGPIRVLVGHLDAVTTVALRGHVLLSAGPDATLRRWDVRQATQSGQISTVGDRVERVLFTRADDILAITETNCCKIWDQRQMVEPVFQKQLLVGGANSNAAMGRIESVEIGLDDRSVLFGDHRGRVGIVDCKEKGENVSFVESGVKRPIYALKQLNESVMAVL